MMETLTGSEKQIAWSETIRAKHMGVLDGYIAKAEAKAEELGESFPVLKRNVQRLQQTRGLLGRIRSAGWWIDNRYRTTDNLCAVVWLVLPNDDPEKMPGFTESGRAAEWAKHL